MNIPDKAVEAAARAWHDEVERSVVEPGDELVLWDYEDEDVKEHYLTTARANVEAAAPFIAAQAVRAASSLIVFRREMAKRHDQDLSAELGAVKNELRRYADDLEAGK